KLNIVSTKFNANVGDELEGVKLEPFSKIIEYFSDSLADKHIKIIVQLPDNITSQEVDQLRRELSTLQMEHQMTLKRTASSLEGSSSKRQKIQETQVENAQKKLIDTVLAMPGPLSVSYPSKFRKFQEDNSIIFLGRPASRIGPPVVLYHKVFGEFVQNFENEELAITSDVAKNTMGVIGAAQEIYNVENDRVNAMNSSFQDIFGPLSTINNADKTEVDAALQTVAGGLNQEAALAILEYKNEIGTGSNDPTIQGSVVYARYWSQNQHERIRRRCCCPSFVIGIAGPWMCVLGAVYLRDMILVEPLTDFLCLTYRSRNDKRIRLVARLLEALKRGFDTLRAYYNSVKDISEDNEARFFPYLQYFGHKHNVTRFRYIDLLTKDLTRPVWIVETENGEKLVVKYVEKYHENAHKSCAKEGLAPKLLYASPRMPGGHRQVVMEYVDAITLHDTISDIRDNRDAAESVYYDVNYIITKVLHPQELVFADLRSPNILVINQDKKFHGMLVDFDWCGVRNKDAYPMAINMELLWPEGVEPGAFLAKKHDNAMLEKLRKELIRPSLAEEHCVV
ncbi:6672_t:CDS:2, partial [Ambispora gerdemannii]